MTRLRCRLLLVTSMLAASASVAQHGGDPLAFRIEPQPMEDALTEVARTSGLQLLFQSQVVTDKWARGVTGSLTPEAAMAELLADSGLRYEFINPKTVTIRTAAAPAKASRTFSSGANGANADAELESRIFQADTEGGGASRSTASSSSRGIDEVVVTGTLLRGVEDISAPVTVYDREAIDRSGFTTTQQFIKSLPQNFSGGSVGATEDGVVGPGSLAQINVESATGVNLRGLGNSSTLVLVNGRRVAPSAVGSVVDVSLIPLNAIERIEVLTDGSSAIYGADAVAGVVNFILRKDYQGAETQLHFGSVTDGSLSERNISQVVGHNWGSGGAVASAQFQDRDSLSVQERSFSSTAERPTDLLPKTKQLAAMVSFHQDLTESLEFFSDATYSRKEVNRNFATAFQEQALSADPRSVSVNAGLAFEAPRDWRIETSGSYSREETTVVQWFDPPVDFSAFGGPVYVNGDTYKEDRFAIKAFDLKADGALFELPGGAVRAAIGGSYRDEDYVATVPWQGDRTEFDRTVRAIFTEILVPLVGRGNQRPFIRKLDFSAAVRHDRYSDFGGTTNPRFGLLWSPTEGLAFRAAYSRSFRAPSAQEESIKAFGLSMINDLFAAPGGGITPVLVLSGSEQQLVPERSKNVVVGFDYVVAAIPQFRVGANLYDIKFRDRILTPPYEPSALLSPDVYGSLITPVADDAAAQAFLDAETARGAQFFDLLGTGVSGVRYLYSVRQQNAATVRQRGIDASLDYDFELGRSKLTAGLNLALIREIQTAFTETSTSTDISNTYGSPLRRRGRADLSWSLGQWQLNGAINHAGSYTDTSVTPRGSVDSWTTVDVNVNYNPAWLQGTRIRLSAVNLFDSDPPEVGGLGLAGIFYDTANADPLGRFVTAEVRKTW